MIALFRPGVVGSESERVAEAMSRGAMSGGGEFTRRAERWLEAHCGCARALLVPSCTHALELAAMLLGIGPGDEVIVPSFTFSSTASAFALHGASIVFVDVEPGTMNLDVAAVADALTPRTRAVVPVHYAGNACDMDALLSLCQRAGVPVIEDAAQALGSSYKGRALGSLGLFGAFSFHATKNVQCGEGGALLINDPAQVDAAEILREKGTDRARFLRGEVEQYSWQQIGSSLLLGELPAAYLSAQLEATDAIATRRRESFSRYLESLRALEYEGHLALPKTTPEAVHNGHLFFVKTRDRATRIALSGALKIANIGSAFHYVPLHTSPAGLQCGRFSGEDRVTTSDSARLLRLPLYDRMAPDDIDAVTDAVTRFYKG